MKRGIGVFSISVLLLTVVSCATTTGTFPFKYNLDDELEAIDQISAYRISNWEQVDNQSIILEADRKTYYLLVLHRPIDRMISGLSIGISSTVSNIRSGFDSIVITDTPFTEYYTIEKIYKLDGKEHAKQIKKLLRSTF